MLLTSTRPALGLTPFTGMPLRVRAKPQTRKTMLEARRFAYVVRSEQEKEGLTPTKKRKFITREEEPEQYWTSKSEREGANPFKDPIAIIAIIAIVAPFIILGIAVGVGYVDLTP